MDPADLYELLTYLETQRSEERLFLRWVIGPQFQVSFDEFKRSLEPRTMRSDEEIMAEVYALFEGVTYGS